MGTQQNKTIETYRNNFNKYVELTVPEVSGELKEWYDRFNGVFARK